MHVNEKNKVCINKNRKKGMNLQHSHSLLLFLALIKVVLERSFQFIGTSSDKAVSTIGIVVIVAIGVIVLFPWRIEVLPTATSIGHIEKAGNRGMF